MAGIVLKVQGPADAVGFFEAKGLQVTGSWQELWQEEHARAFTVAHLARLDLLQEIHGALGQAIREGLDYRAFAKGLVPKLQAAGWWNQPVPEGKPLSPARLRLIYDTNLRTSYMAAKWGRIQRLKGRRPFLRYDTMKDSRVRPTHQVWEGIVLPVDHAWWQTHFPPNGWKCRCDTEQLSQADLDAEGLEVTPDAALPQGTKTFVNRTTGEVTTVPNGIDPGWAYNPGQAGSRAAQLGRVVGEKLTTAAPELSAQAYRSAGVAFTEPLQAQLGDWAARLQGGTLKPSGNQVVLGALLPEVEAFLTRVGLAAETAALSLSDREFLHMSRPAKAERGAAWSMEMLLALPEMLARPARVLWDTLDQVLLYVWDVEGQAAKAVIRVNYRVKSEGQRIRTNLIKTTGLVKPEDLNDPRYQVVL